MRLLTRTKFISFILFFSFGNQGFGEQNYLLSQLRVQELFKKYENSLVRVKATRQNLVDGKTKRLLKMGSGFFVSKDGHILTTGVLKNADRIWVEHKNKYFLTETIGSDSLCNLTLLKTLEKPEKFKYVSFSSNQSVAKVGSFLLGITCALEFEIGPTIGLLQSNESSFGSTLFPTKMLRTSLSLGPGEVGGPVFDLNGNFIGITYAALPDLRSSFILSAKSCARIRDELILSGSVDYGWFGITVTRKLNEENGFNIIIKSVGDNTKLQKEDVILKIGNTEISDRGDLVDSSFYSRPGTFVEFLIERNGKNLTIPVRVSPRPISIQDEKSDLSDSVLTTSDDLKLKKSTDENRSDFNESGIFNP
jgi:S1-C subfamily serine protease